MSGTASASNGTDPKTATATCTGSRVAIGGGYTATATTPGNVENVTVTESRATSDTVWSVTADADNITGNWSIQAYVVCATSPSAHSLKPVQPAPAQGAGVVRGQLEHAPGPVRRDQRDRSDRVAPDARGCPGAVRRRPAGR